MKVLFHLCPFLLWSSFLYVDSSFLPELFYFFLRIPFEGFPGGSNDKESACNAGNLGLIPWGRKWQPAPVFLPGESHGQRSLVGCSPRGHKESDTTERLTHTHPRTPFNISYKADLLTTNSSIFISLRKIVISFSFLKDTFSRYRSLVCCFFPLKTKYFILLISCLCDFLGKVRCGYLCYLC